MGDSDGEMALMGDAGDGSDGEMALMADKTKVMTDCATGKIPLMEYPADGRRHL